MSWTSKEKLNTLYEIIKHTGAQNVCISSILKTKIFFLTKQDTLREVLFTTHHLI